MTAISLGVKRNASRQADAVSQQITPSADTSTTRSSHVSNAKLQQQYVDAYDTTGQPLRKPVNLDAVPWLVTNAIPSFMSGTMSNRATDIFAGDF